MDEVDVAIGYYDMCEIVTPQRLAACHYSQHAILVTQLLRWVRYKTIPMTTDTLKIILR
jgi:hypothetical protein